MTGYTVNTGSTTEFAAGWDRIFGSERSGAKQSEKAAAKKQAGKPAKGKKKQPKRASQSARSGRRG